MTVSITFLGLTISIIVCVFIIVVTVLARAKHKIQQELEQFKEHHVLYDEIELPEQIENVAYVSTVQH